MSSANQGIGNITKVQLDVFDMPLTIPVGRLDADQYSADDLDGVTESIFGSGNMSYASLQASQTDAALASNNFLLQDGNGFFLGGEGDGVFAGRAASMPLDDGQGATGAQQSDEIITNTDRPIGYGDGGLSGVSENANYTASTVGAVSASQLASNTGVSSSSSSSQSYSDSSTGLDGSGGADGRNGTNGVNGNTPDAPTGDGCCPPTLIDLGDTLIAIDNIVTNLGDTITNLSTSIVDITQVLGDVISSLDISNFLDLTDITNLVSNINNNLTQNIDNTLTQITNLTENVTNLLENILGGDPKDLVLGLDVNVLDTLLTDVRIPLADIGATDINLDVDLTPTLTFANNLADMTGLDVLSDALGNLGGATQTLQNTIDQFTGVVSDFSLANPAATVTDAVQTLGAVLDNLDETVGAITASVDDTLDGLLENLGIGDIGGGDLGDVLAGGGLLGNVLGGGNDDGADSDLTADLGLNVLGLPLVEELPDLALGLDPVEDLLGDLDIDLGLGLDLLGSNNIDNGAGDTDITGQIGIDLVDNTVGDLITEIPLDPIEALLGDIDLDLGIAGNLLGDLADPLVNDGFGGAGDDGLLANIGDDLGDLTGGILGLNGDDAGDTDLGIDTGIALLDQAVDDGAIDVVLDPVEDLIGDLDIDLGLGADLLGSGEEIDNGAGDSDLSLDLDVAGLDLPQLDIPLDPIEAITGDIDLNLDIDADIGGILGLLGGDAGDIADNDALGDWTETIISDDNSLFGDVLSGLGGGVDTLPDPVSTVVGGLGVLDIGSNNSGFGGLGGLFG